MKLVPKLTFIICLHTSFLLSSAYGAGVISLPMLKRAGSPVEAAFQQGGFVMGDSVWNVIGNPAISGLQDYPEFAMSYETLAFGSSFQNFVYTKPTRYGTLGFDLRYMGNSDITVVDDNFTSSSVASYDALASMIYGVHFADISFGVKGSVINSQLADFIGRTFSLDASTIFYFDAPSFFDKTKNLNLGIGFIVRNLSPGISYAEVLNPLPLYYGAGIYYNISNFEYLKTNLEVFSGIYQQVEVNYGAAIEFNIYDYAKLRGGISMVKPQGSAGFAAKFSFGMSVLLDVAGYIYDVAYSLEPGTGNLEAYHNIGLRVQLGGGRDIPFGMSFGKKSTKEKRKDEFKESEDSDVHQEDKSIIYLLRQAIASHKRLKGRFPVDLNELLLFLNEYKIYEIPNPKKGSYRYNKRSGKLFIRF